jgi:uncharacterized protein YciW
LVELFRRFPSTAGPLLDYHEATAAEFGVPGGMALALLSDVDTAPVSDKLKPIFRFVRKLTLAPSTITQHDADAVYAEGWGEQALYDAASVCALFNLMNRLVEGTGIKATPGYSEVAAKRLQALSYTALKDMIR